MHVLGRSFSQKRKSSPKPRDLHIRKVSFSGSSLSSLSSASSSSTARAYQSDRSYSGSPNSGRFDPLHLHPTFQPPARLSERPFIRTEQERYEQAATFYDDEESVADFLDDDSEADVTEKELYEEQPFEMELPPHASPMDHGEDDISEPQDYFMLQLAKRPPMPRSRWSESTINTIDSITPGSSATPSIISEPQMATTVCATNFSYKRSTIPTRPSIQAVDSFDNYVKRGGWKRRGIVFNSSEVDSQDETDSGFAC